MPEKNEGNYSEITRNIDLYSLLFDLIRNWWVIVLCALIAGMAANVYATQRNVSAGTYTTSATFVVTARGSSNSVYSNLSSAQTMAATFSSVMNSTIMQKIVCDDLGLSSFDATVDASVPEGTNLLVLQVTAGTPERAYGIIRSIMEHYPELTSVVIGSTIMEVFKEPEVPTTANTHINVMNLTRRGLIVGAIAAVGILLFLSYNNDTIKKPADLTEKLDSKSLGVIYFEHKYKTLRSWFRHKKKSILISDPTASFGFVESNQKIAAKLSYQKRDHLCLTTVVTSMLENEGKSTVATNLALALVQSSANVLLVDCDLRKPSLHLILEQKDEGKMNYPELVKQEIALSDMMYHDEKTGLYTLQVRKPYSNASELLSDRSMQAFFTQLKPYFDYIILDSPPLSAGADAEYLAGFADVSMLVVRYNLMQARDINDGIDELRECNATFAGCVLNQAHAIHLPGSAGRTYGYGGHYGYGNYYSSGDAEHE